MNPAPGQCRRRALELRRLDLSSPPLNWSDGCRGKCPQLESWFSESSLPLLSLLGRGSPFADTSRCPVPGGQGQSGCALPAPGPAQEHWWALKACGDFCGDNLWWNRYKRVESGELTRNVEEKGFSRKKLGRGCHLISPDKLRSPCLCFQDRNS